MVKFSLKVPTSFASVGHDSRGSSGFKAFSVIQICPAYVPLWVAIYLLIQFSNSLVC